MDAERKPIVVAVDGPAASGKGTVARRLAATCRLAHLDTGLLYRAVAGRVLRQGEALEDEGAAAAAAQALEAADLEGDALRSSEMGAAASVVAQQTAVRAALLDYQRRFAAEIRDGLIGAVLDGRDIGTVVCPDADVKLFVTAAVEERARRRAAELAARGLPSDVAEILAALKARDARDRERSAAPLVQARDAHLLDTTFLSIEQAVAEAASIVRQAVGAMSPNAEDVRS